MSEMENQGETPPCRLWTPRTIGWLTILFGYASGFVLASINWYRMGRRRKANVHTALGFVLSAVWSVVWFLGDYYYWDSRTALIVWLAAFLPLTFAIVAYLHKAVERDVARYRTEHPVAGGPLPAALGIAVVVMFLASAVGTGATYVARYLLLPRVESTADLVPGSGPAVSGTLHPWRNEPVAGRRIALCRLVVDTVWNPYDCEMTRHTAVSDEAGQFQFESVPPASYLVFYDSGTADFDAGVERWAGRVIELGSSRSWLFSNDFFSTGDAFVLIFPPGSDPSVDSFYYNYPELTLVTNNSPFFLAHDIEKALSYAFERGLLERMPRGLFQPEMVEVVDGYTGHVEFDVLYFGDADGE